MKWCIARPKQGIALNGFEYACYPGSDKVAVFDNPEQAKIAMLYYGIDDAEVEKQGLLIIPYYPESEEGGEKMKEYLTLPRGGIKYTKPKIITCKDCIGYATCPERSRLYPCKDYKPTRKRSRSD